MEQIAVRRSKEITGVDDCGEGHDELLRSLSTSSGLGHENDTDNTQFLFVCKLPWCHFVW